MQRLWISRMGRQMLVGAGLLALLIGPESTGQAGSTTELGGRWDLTLLDTDGFSSAWLEIVPRMHGRASGRLVWLYGGVEPTGDILIGERAIRFQHNFVGEQLNFTATLEDGRLKGTTTSDRSPPVRWVGLRAPSLPPPVIPVWEQPRALFNGQDLAGWVSRSGKKLPCWKVEGGVLFNDTPCSDLVSESRFDDFQLHVEFQLRDGGGSGVYLRGRYEAQIANDAGSPSGLRTTGAIFGQLSPSSSEAKPQGEWQTLDVTLLGRTVTVTVNGKKVISEQEIPGITGAALDSHEDRPGPIMLQGDHGRIAFRNILLTPAR